MHWSSMSDPALILNFGVKPVEKRRHAAVGKVGYLRARRRAFDFDVPDVPIAGRIDFDGGLPGDDEAGIELNVDGFEGARRSSMMFPWRPDRACIFMAQLRQRYRRDPIDPNRESSQDEAIGSTFPTPISPEGKDCSTINWSVSDAGVAAG
jgi:hypothetical protein